MQRRKFITNSIGFGLAMQPLVKILGKNIVAPHINIAKTVAGGGLSVPIMIYDNWSAYDKLSDNIPLTEELAMKELEELLRWEKNKVAVDYYIMDAFWFDKNGAYRTWDKQYWPKGPDKWLSTCKENNIKTGLWFAVNLIASGGENFLDVIPEWKDSIADGGTTMCLFEGGYLKHYADTLQMWIDKGVQALMFDFAYFDAATPEAKKTYLPDEIEEMNKRAFFGMLKEIKLKNPEILTLAFNGFGGQMENTYEAFRKSVDSRWLEVFDTMYCGDPRFADVPAMNIWRSEDIYSDQMVRLFELNDIPLKRIANCEFMAGKTGTCYYRAKEEWKGNVILDMARGGWANLYYGNLELFSDQDAQWFAKAQNIFHNLQAYGIINSFGAMPGTAKPYGYTATNVNGAVITVVNPMQAIADVDLPVNTFSKSNIIFYESGFKPVLAKNKLTLGAEQLVVIGIDEYADEKYNLGVDNYIHIPASIDNMNVSFTATGKNIIEGKINPVQGKNIRIIFQQFGDDGFPVRSWGGSPPNGKKMDAFLKIIAKQIEKILPAQIEYDKMIWSGLSWAAGEIKSADIDPNKSITIQCISTETAKLNLKANVYAVEY